jgi:Uncharacterized conserved protein (DUF2045)
MHADCIRLLAKHVRQRPSLSLKLVACTGQHKPRPNRKPELNITENDGLETDYKESIRRYVNLTPVPYKYRMDVKDATTNEFAFPLVYYCVHDFEMDDLQLTLKPDEYLCVELSVTLPPDLNNISYQTATEFVAGISVTDDPSPFPLPNDFNKIVLFQGAVPFAALLETYMQKGAGTQTKKWGRQREARTEYIIMRGPLGKGQCQVAINEPAVSELEPEEKPKTFLGMFSTALKSLGGHGEETARPQALVASITYVNCPWQSLATDFVEYQKSATVVE